MTPSGHIFFLMAVLGAEIGAAKAVSGRGESRGTSWFSAGHMARLTRLGVLARNFRIPASAAEQDQNRNSGCAIRCLRSSLDERLFGHRSAFFGGSRCRSRTLLTCANV